jgi:hypothetical protein
VLEDAARPEAARVVLPAGFLVDRFDDLLEAFEVDFGDVFEAARFFCWLPLAALADLSGPLSALAACFCPLRAFSAAWSLFLAGVLRELIGLY